MDIGSTYAARASTAASVLDSLKAMRAQSAAQKAEEKTAAQKQAAEDIRDLPKKTRDDVRARAKLKVTQLLERLKLIKEMGQNDPKMMAKMLANLTKELKAAVKEYASAGGNSMDVSAFSSAQTTASIPAPETSEDGAKDEVEAASEDAAAEAAEAEDAEQIEDSQQTVAPEETAEPAPPSPAQTRAAAEAYVKTERSRAENELSDVHDFMKHVRAITKKVKEMFETAKIQLAFQKVDKATVEAFESSGKDMKEIDDMLDDLDKGLEDERVVFGPKAALFA